MKMAKSHTASLSESGLMLPHNIKWLKARMKYSIGLELNTEQEIGGKLTWNNEQNEDLQYDELKNRKVGFIEMG